MSIALRLSICVVLLGSAWLPACDGEAGHGANGNVERVMRSLGNAPDVVGMPAPNSVSVFAGAAVAATFPDANHGFESSQLMVAGEHSGKRLMGEWSGDGTQSIAFEPSVSFAPGERLVASLLSGYAYTFRARTAPAQGDVGDVSTYASGHHNKGRGFAVGDIDGDGDMDVIHGSFQSATAYVFHNNGDGTLVFNNTVKIGGGAPSGGGVSPLVALGDIDGDGDLDLLADWVYGWRVFYNNGAGSFTRKDHYGMAGWCDPKGRMPEPRFFDLDLDGVSEYVLGCDGNVTIGNDPGEWATTLPLPMSDIAVDLGDVNGDGRLDIVAVGEEIRVLLKTAGGATDFSEMAPVPLPAHGGTVRLGDMDGDGDLDAVTEGAAVHLNDGTGVFSPGLPIDDGDATVVGDYNGDGTLDVVVRGYKIQRLYLNDGSANFTYMWQTWAGKETRHAPFLVDMDGDGDLDRTWIRSIDGGTVFVALQNDVDACPGDGDADGDYLCDSVDPCPNDPENDVDNDGVCADVDNCDYTPNPDQSDQDGDSIGDACDAEPTICTVVALANGDPFPPTVTYPTVATNGSFSIHGDPCCTIVGDGQNEETQWVWDLSTNPFVDQITGPGQILEATVLLDLQLAGADGVATDHIKFSSAPPINIVAGTTGDPIVDYQRAERQYDVIAANQLDTLFNALTTGGTIPMVYEDDATVVSATLALKLACTDPCFGNPGGPGCAPVSACEIADNYSDAGCNGTFKAYSTDDLEAYVASDFGRAGGAKYMNLKIMADLAADTLDIESPCTITLENDVRLEAAFVSLDGRNGVHDDNGFVIQADAACILSERDTAGVGSGGEIVADSLTIRAEKTVKIGQNAVVAVTGDMVLESTGDVSSSDVIVKSNASVTAGSLSLSASRGSHIGENVTANVSGPLSIVSTGDYTGSDAGIKQGATVQAGSVSISASRTAKIGQSVSLNATGTVDVTSTGSASGSEAFIKANANVTVGGDLNMVSGNKVKLGGGSQTNVTGNAYLEAESDSKCFLDGTLTSATESGNCFD